MDKSEFVTKSAGIIVTFSCKNISHIASKTFANKATCRTPSGNPRYLWAHYPLVEKLSTCCDYFLRLSGFSNLSGKVFLITSKFS